ncbi:MAG: hypothetical protein P8181_05850 [bacterium]
MALLASCGKKEEKAAGEEGGKSAESASKLVEIAKEAADEVSIEEDLGEDIPAMIESAGFTLKSYDNFPTEEVGRKGRMLVYTDQKGKHTGGVIYFKKTGPAIAPCWHWYFDSAVPEAVSNVELNDDGLWDVKIATKNGDAMTFIQDDSFTLMAKDRTDYIATNAKSSTPVSDDAAVWLCFDGDTTTAWKTAAASAGGAFIEFHVPFGVEEGNLAIQTLDSDQPKSCTVYADGKEIEVVDFEGKAVRQMVHLGEDAQGAKLIRLAFAPGQGQGGVIAIAEIGLK